MKSTPGLTTKSSLERKLVSHVSQSSVANGNSWISVCTASVYSVVLLVHLVADQEL